MYKGRPTSSSINFFLLRKLDRKLCMNCRIILGKSLTTQHRVLVMDIWVMRKVKRNGRENTSMIRRWHLKDEKQREFQRKIVDEVS